jgi:hypothetical protein
VAVVQISKIQIRRGQENQGSGLPQLASGELGWAIDTQSLYVGNGSVAEGAPNVGNTKVITEHDDLFTLADSYVYKEGTGVINTGVDATNPIKRSLQARLDDQVSVKAFGVNGVEAVDCTLALQRAIDQLYLNGGQEASTNNRVVLTMEAGVYTISDTIYIPPHATIRGAGSGKTIIRQIGNLVTNPASPGFNEPKAVFQTVNDLSQDGNPADDSDSTFNNQARNISLSGMTLQAVGTSRGLVLQSCRDSDFNDIEIVGTWIPNAPDTILPLGTDQLEDGDNSTIRGSYLNPFSPTPGTRYVLFTTSLGLSLNSKNGGVETVRNKFTNCSIRNWAYAIVSNWDINDNVFVTCNFTDSGYGAVFGKDMTIDGLPGAGTAFGPSNNIWSDCVFTNISRQAIYVKEGTNNVSRNNKYITCGNDGASDDIPEYSIIKYTKLGNASINDFFTRTQVLSYTQSINPSITPNILGTVVYIPEVEGPTNYVWGFEHQVTVLSGQELTLFRLPQAINQAFEVTYTMTSETYNAMRTGKLTIMLNGRTDVSAGTPRVEVSDDYHYVGDSVYLDSIYLDATLRDINNDGNFDTLVVRSNSLMTSDDRTQFKFKVETKQTDLS